MVKIFIDPGHGGTDPGARGNGLLEKNLTLAIARKIRDLLNDYENVQVRLSREGDQTLSLEQRSNAANAWGADYLVSVHVNAGGGTGFESFIFNGAVSSATVTNQNVMHSEIIKHLGLRDRGKKRAGFHMLRASVMPAILTENGFIDHANDAALLKSDLFLNKVAQGHVAGLVKIFGLKKKAEPNPQPQTGDTYTVKSGDTLWAISRRHGMTVNDLKALNGLKSDIIHPGDILKVRKSTETPDLRVGQKVKIKQSASNYATGETIPSWVKGQTYTIQQVKDDRILLKEILSWVYKKDVE